jgi:hypothetical protein
MVKRTVKRRMEGLLQRKAENHELISISSWMNAMNEKESLKARIIQFSCPEHFSEYIFASDQK